MKLAYEFKQNMVEWHLVGTKGYYSTDKEGKGVFFISDGSRSQLLGTAQFSVAGLTKGSARAKIRKFMAAR